MLADCWVSELCVTYISWVWNSEDFVFVLSPLKFETHYPIAKLFTAFILGVVLCGMCDRCVEYLLS